MEGLRDEVARLKCGSIVVIDDKVPDIESIRGEIGALGESPTSVADAVVRMGGWPRETEERFALVERIIDERSFAERREITAAIFAELKAKAPDWDSVFAEPLVHLRDAGAVNVLSVSPREWSKHAPRYSEAGVPVASLPQAIPIDGTPVFLFDYDLSTLPGRRNDEGLSLARTLLKETSPHASYCGVISQSFNNADTAATVRKRLDPSERDRIVLLSRDMMQEPRTLAGHLLAVYRAHSANVLRTIAESALERAHEGAMAGLRGLEVTPLLHAVVNRSYVEGMSEFETVRRLYLLKFNRSLDMVEVDGVQLQKLATELRALKLPEQDPPIDVIDLEHEERYPPIKTVNGRRLPIDTGDVFSLKQPGETKAKKYVLLSHPCDLMIRKDGKREVLAGQKETTMGVLLPLTDSEVKGAQGYQLPFAKERVDKHRGDLWVRFRPALYFPLYILDMCAFAEDGQSRMSRDASPPAGIPASQAALHKHLISRLADILAAHQPGPPPAAAPIAHGDAGGQGEAPADIPVELKVPSGARAEVSGRVKADRVEYDCKRIMRIDALMAARLLAEYSHFTGRDAAPMDLARRA